MITANDEDYDNFNVSYTSKEERIWHFTVNARLHATNGSTSEVQLLIREKGLGNFFAISLNKSVPIAFKLTSHKTFNGIYNGIQAKINFPLDYARSIIETLNTLSRSTKISILTPSKIYLLLITEFGWSHQTFINSKVEWLIEISQKQETKYLPNYFNSQHLTCDSQSAHL